MVKTATNSFFVRNCETDRVKDYDLGSKSACKLDKYLTVNIG